MFPVCHESPLKTFKLSHRFELPARADGGNSSRIRTKKEKERNEVPGILGKSQQQGKGQGGSRSSCQSKIKIQNCDLEGIVVKYPFGTLKEWREKMGVLDTKPGQPVNSSQKLREGEREPSS